MYQIIDEAQNDLVTYDSSKENTRTNNVGLGSLNNNSEI